MFIGGKEKRNTMLQVSAKFLKKSQQDIIYVSRIRHEHLSALRRTLRSLYLDDGWLNFKAKSMIYFCINLQNIRLLQRESSPIHQIWQIWRTKPIKSFLLCDTPRKSMTEEEQKFQCLNASPLNLLGQSYEFLRKGNKRSLTFYFTFTTCFNESWYTQLDLNYMHNSLNGSSWPPSRRVMSI